MKKYLSFFAAALLLAACQSDDIVDQKGVAPEGSIQFGVASTQEITRTSGMTKGVIGEDESTGETSIKKYGFGVFASYTGDNVYENVTVTPNFMYNQEVTLDDATLGVYPGEYYPLKYWPNTGKTTFFAYAPYVDHTKIDFEKPQKTHCIAGMSDPNDEGDPWLIYVLAPDPFAFSNGQSDLLIGGYETESGSKYVSPYFDIEKATFDAKPMKFTFFHALGIVGDKIKIQVSDALQEELNKAENHNARVYIDHIDMKFKNLTRKAKLILNSKQNVPNWKPIVSGEVTTNREYTITRDEIIAANNNTAVNTGLNLSSDPSDVIYSTEGGDFDQSYYNSKKGITAANSSNAIELLTGKGLFYIPYQVDENPQELEITLYYQVLADGMEPYNGVAKSTTRLKTRNGHASDIIIKLDKSLKYDKIYAPQIGDFYYSDGTWGELNTHDTGAKPIGVVGYLGNDIGTYNAQTGVKGTAKHGLVIAFKNSKHNFTSYLGSTKYNRWGIVGHNTELSDYSSFSDAYNDLNGEYNTNVLFNQWTVHLAFAAQNYWAAWECSEYEADGVGAKGNWHLGTFGEWARIFDALGKTFANGSGTDISSGISSMTDGQIFYPSLDESSHGSMLEMYDQNVIQKYWIFEPSFEGDFVRNNFQSGLRYWTSTEVNNDKAISFGFYWIETPKYNDGVMFFKDADTTKDKQYLIRPLLTF